MKSSLSEIIKLHRDLLTDYCIQKYVTWEDEQEYLQMFEQAVRARRRAFGKNMVSTIMFSGDAENYRRLPRKLTIYRGYHTANKREGISWSLSKQVADSFAHNCWAKDVRDAPPSVVRGICSLKDVLAYTNDLREEEIIINPKDVRGIVNVVVGPDQEIKAHAEPLDKILAGMNRSFVL